MPAQKYLTELHQDHKEWLNILSFYEEDVESMKKRLNEVASKNTDREIAHDWREIFAFCESKIIQNVEENPVASDRRKSDDHVELRERVETFEFLFNKLRKDLNSFVAKWM